MFNLINKNSPTLRQKAEQFDFNDPPFDPIEFAHNIVKFMYDNNALGIAGPQIGLSQRVFAMRGHPENFVCFNPRIIDYGEKQIYLEEGCLTFPNLVLKVKRPQNIKVRFQMPNSEVVTHKFSGITARIFQHEYDHLEGILFTSRANRYHLEKGLKKGS